MVISFILLVPTTIFALLFFIKSSPKALSIQSSVLKFNVITIAAAILSCALLTYSTYRSMVDTVDRAWWPAISSLGSLILFPTLLLVGAFIRMIAFRKLKK